MNWKTLRPLLRQEFGQNFGFYNDLYKSGNRRIKIRTDIKDVDKIFNYIKSICPELNVNIYEETVFLHNFNSITIHYR
jgi:hypothetical protein